jgi:hypothetical protein
MVVRYVALLAGRTVAMSKSLKGAQNGLIPFWVPPRGAKPPLPLVGVDWNGQRG